VEGSVSEVHIQVHAPDLPLGIAGRELSAIRRQVGDHKMSGSRISMRLPE
jgi:hypothetical protein